MFKNIILTTFSLASIFGMNLILNENSIELNRTAQKRYIIKDENSIAEQNFYIEDRTDNYTEPEKDSLIKNIPKTDAQIRQLMNEADSFADKEKYLEAIKKYDEVIRLTEDSKDIKKLRTFAGANYLKAFLYSFYLEDKKRAISIYDEVANRFRDSQDIELLKLYFKAEKHKLQLIDDKKDMIEIYQNISNRFEKSTDVELIDMYIFAQKNIAYNIDNIEDKIEIYDNILEKTKYSDNKILLEHQIEIQNEKINILISQQRKEEAIDIYDEIINDFKEDDRFIEDVTDAMIMKSYYISSEDRVQALDILDELIDIELEKEDRTSSINLEISTLNALELAIITDIDESRYEDLIKDNFQDRADIMAEYDMLKIIKNAQYSNQDKAIEDWKNRHGDYKLDAWDFSSLNEWSNSFEDIDIKQRVSKYIKFFESRH